MILEDVLTYCMEDHRENCRKIARLQSTTSTKKKAAAGGRTQQDINENVQELQEQCKRLAKGVIKVVEMAMDKVYSQPHKSSTSPMVAELMDSLPHYRRLLQLHTQYEIYMTIEDIRSMEACLHKVEVLTVLATEKWLDSLPDHAILPGDPNEQQLLLEDLHRFDDAVVKLQKVGRLLNTSTQVFVRAATKKILETGRKVGSTALQN